MKIIIFVLVLLRYNDTEEDSSIKLNKLQFWKSLQEVATKRSSSSVVPLWRIRRSYLSWQGGIERLIFENREYLVIAERKMLVENWERIERS